MADSGLTLLGLTKHFGEHTAVRDLSLGVSRGSVLALLGPSGSGKTTTLRLIAGFEKPDAGTVVVAGRDVTSLGPADRRFGMVFQNYALFPHLDVAGNVAFGLSRSLAGPERRARVAHVLELVDLRGFEGRKVTELSGGQQQRVAVARAVAPEPEVLLLDEPLSNLDPALRERTRRELRGAIDQIGVTTIFVTHEQDEAFALGDVIAVLRDGALEQVGAPPVLYEEPATRFVATFVGRASTIPGTWGGDGRVEVVGGGEAVRWPSTAAADFRVGASVEVVVRPESLELTDGPGLSGTVRSRRYTGARTYFEVETAVGVLELDASFQAAQVGDTVRVSARTCRVFPRGDG